MFNELQVEKALDARCRRKALANDMRVYKSRVRQTDSNNQGGYMITDDRNTVRYGDRYELTLKQVADILDVT